MSEVKSTSTAKKTLVYICFGLFSIIFVGIMFGFTTELNPEASKDYAFSSWLILAYLAGLSMIMLPCTLPFVFIIVPMTVDKGYRMGLIIAVLFGIGMTTTITLYGLGLGYLGQYTGLTEVASVLMLVAGIISFVFGLQRLKLIKISTPSYSGTPGFMKGRGEYSKSYLMGVLVGNAGVGCTNPLFYMMLFYIMGTGSPEIGVSLGFVHGIGRAIPLVLVAVLAVLGFNPTKVLVTKRVKVEKASGIVLIILGSFLIINSMPEGQFWYLETFLHPVWNDVVETLNLPEELTVRTIEEFQIPELIHHGEFMSSMSTRDEWKLYLGWSPQGPIELDKEITFNIMFHDPITDVMGKDITYDFEVYQNGELIESRPNSQTPSGHDLQDFTFEKKGLIQVKIKNINGLDTGGEFTFMPGIEMKGEMFTIKHGEPRFPLEFIPISLTGLIASPIIWYIIKNRKKEVSA